MVVSNHPDNKLDMIKLLLKINIFQNAKRMLKWTFSMPTLLYYAKPNHLCLWSLTLMLWNKKREP